MISKALTDVEINHEEFTSENLKSQRSDIERDKLRFIKLTF